RMPVGVSGPRLNGLNANLPLEIDQYGGEQVGGRPGPVLAGGAYQNPAENVFTYSGLSARSQAESGQVFLGDAQFVVRIGSQDGQQDKANVRTADALHEH